MGELQVVEAELVDDPPAGLARTLPDVDGDLVAVSIGPARVPYPYGRLRTRPRGGALLIGGVVTDLAEVAAVAARVKFYARPWWRRAGRRRPG